MRINPPKKNPQINTSHSVLNAANLGDTLESEITDEKQSNHGVTDELSEHRETMAPSLRTIGVHQEHGAEECEKNEN